LLLNRAEASASADIILPHLTLLSKRIPIQRQERPMKYLCLAYGDEKDWKALTKDEQNALLSHDEVLRQRGDLVAAVQGTVTTVQAWDGTPVTSAGGIAHSALPLAGFGIIEARDLEEVVELIRRTPCARAKGVIEVRPIMAINDPGPYAVHQHEPRSVRSTATG
jgi:hypothetical protein